MDIQLSDHFTYRRLLRFTLPSICMMIFTSVYGVVDGYFVSNYLGKTSFAAVNFIYPFVMILSSVGFMFGTGGSALVGKILGEGEREKANQVFSLLVYVSTAAGFLLAVFGLIGLRPMTNLLGVTGDLLEDAVLYGKILLLGLPFFILQMLFQSFFVTAEKPQFGFAVTLTSGIANMVLDALLVAVWNGGLVGAALATVLSQVIGGLIPLIYFFRSNSSPLQLGCTRWDGKALIKASGNGTSELLSNLSMSFINMLYNTQLMHYVGEDGVSAYGVVMYINFIFIAAFIGYSMGSAPVVSYHYGAKNRQELGNILHKSIVLIVVSSLLMFLAGELCSDGLTHFFVGYDASLRVLTKRGFSLYSFMFLFAGISIYGSSFFTALNDGVTSAVISFLRTVVFQVLFVLLLPILFGVDGIWLSVVAAEAVSFTITVFFFWKKKEQYLV